MNYCSKCGSKLVDGAKYCSKCGSKTDSINESLNNSESIESIESKNEDNTTYEINNSSNSEFKSLTNLSTAEVKQRSKRNSLVVKSLIGFFIFAILIQFPTLFKNPKEIIFINRISSLYVNEEYRLNIRTDIEDFDTTGFSWDSSNRNVATVSKGVIKGISEGTAIISVSNGKKLVNQFELSVSYNPVVELNTAVSSVFIVGDIKPFNIVISPQNASNKTLTFSSSDESIATIDSIGNILAKSKGTVVLKATSIDGIEISHQIKVYNKVESIELNKESIELREGSSTTITAVISPKNANDVPLVWSSSDENIATVENGKILGKSLGKAEITVSAGSVSKTIIVYVQRKSPISIVNFRYTKDSVGGIEWNFRIRNNSSKDINYVTMAWYNFNAVGDFVYDEISGRNYTRIRFTGPLKAGSTTTTRRNTTLFYNHSYRSSVFYEFIIEYSDGSTETIKFEDMIYWFDITTSK